MKRIIYLLATITIIFVLLFTIAPSIQKFVQAATTEQASADAVGILISRTNSEGRIQNTTQGIWGPRICTAYGDPFSPWTSPWEPNSYTYRYQIRIPASYTEDVVRVELFDPDSVNQAANEFTIAYSSNALSHPTFNAAARLTTRFCGIDGGSNEQKNPCVLRTQELEMIDPLATQLGISPIYTMDQINPFWLVRVDENRGAGAGGNDICAAPATYDTQYNTQTLFELYYQQDDGNGGTSDVPLASYTGNTGDARDVNGFHQTDMHWVSPGADKQGFDYPITDVADVSEVPTDEGDTSFEIDLTNDVANIVIDPTTGERFLYLNITSLSGASENVFEIWAGPATYANTEPSNVNFRNVTVTNDPSSHNADGVQVEAISRLPINNLYANPIDWPLTNYAADAAGGTITVSIFDMDSGAKPPITFYFDSIPESEWSLTFSDPGVTDPDGVETEPSGPRCQIGGGQNGVPGNGCNNQWTTPYQIIIPGILTNCDPLNPTQADCTPFSGGRLMARVNAGDGDTHVWEIGYDSPSTDSSDIKTYLPFIINNPSVE